MSEKARFHEMTKPMKFRRFKMVKQYIVLWYKAVRERIKYFFNYILYKLNILKRYSYRDMTEQVFSLPYNVKTRTIETGTFRCTVVMRVIKETFYDMDYFYRQKKNGSKKITLWVKNEEDSKLFVDSHLEDICLKISDKWYEPNNLPILKVAVMGKPPVAFEPSKSLDSVGYETVSYDLVPLKTLRFRSLLGKLNLSDVSEPMIYYYYEYACGEFTNKLKSMSLHDLMR